MADRHRIAPEGKSIKMEPHPKIMDILATTLKSHGHECAMIVGASDHKFEWCGKDICERAVSRQRMNHMQRERQKFADELEASGHTCIKIAESYPIQIHWCESEVCANSKK
uniref:Uncharacterized protein n=1 Tax=viral metagenome TaxID=1070528 RepID=A0A6C0C928_9ZZZZ